MLRLGGVNFQVAAEPHDEVVDGARVGVLVQIPDVFENGLAPYASYSTSFSPISGIDINGKPFVPEKGKQIEGGFKVDLRSLRTFATFAVFDLRKQNVPTAATPDNPFGPQIQTQSMASSATISSIEPYARASPTRRERASAAASSALARFGL